MQVEQFRVHLGSQRKNTYLIDLLQGDVLDTVRSGGSSGASGDFSRLVFVVVFCLGFVNLTFLLNENFFFQPFISVFFFKKKKKNKFILIL